MSDFGIKVSKTGARTSSDSSLDFVMSSKYRNMITVKVATATYTFATPSYGTGTVRLLTLFHGLGYKPAYIAYMEDTDNPGLYTYIPLGSWSWNIDGFGSWETNEAVKAHADANNFYIDLVKTALFGSPPADGTAWRNKTGITFKFKIYIFANSV